MINIIWGLFILTRIIYSLLTNNIDIINSDIVYEDDFSVDLIDWYRDLIFSCDGDNNDDIKVVRDIDRCMYLYINDNKY